MKPTACFVWIIIAVAALLIACENPSGSGGSPADTPPDSGSGPSENDTTPPAPVSSVSSDPGAGYVTLLWNDPADTDLADVEITWSPAGSVGQPMVAPAGAGSATVSGLRPETSYDFTLTAIDASGNRSSEVNEHATTIALFNNTANEIGSLHGVSALGAADLDGDGVEDLFAGGVRAQTAVDPGSVAWFERTGASFSTYFSATSEVQKVVSIDGIDIDGDGDVDLLSGASGTQRLEGKVVWYENTNGDGSDFSMHDIAARVNDTFYIATGDLNGDGTNDVVSGSFEGNGLEWYENTKSGSGETGFSSGSPIAPVTDKVTSVQLADVDGDADLDVVVSSYAGISWYENRLSSGQGFSGASDVTDASIHRVLTVDVDGDNDLDLIALSTNNDEILWFENGDGDGTFEAAEQVAAFDSPQSAHSADVDGDGDVDLVAVSYQNTGLVVWFENTDGAGSFAAPTNIESDLTLPNRVLAFDIDGDGDLDVVTSQSDGSIVWYENQLVN